MFVVRENLGESVFGGGGEVEGMGEEDEAIGVRRRVSQADWAASHSVTLSLNSGISIFARSLGVRSVPSGRC